MKYRSSSPIWPAISNRATRGIPVRVRIGASEYEVDDAALRNMLSRAAAEDIRLLQVGRGTFDSMPVSVLSTATSALIEARCGGTLDVRRFRANILVAAPDGASARETDWVGGTLIFGDAPSPAKLRVNTPIDRCMMITMDPENAARDPAILRRVVEEFNNEIGVRGATEAPGTISVGDPVHLVRLP